MRRKKITKTDEDMIMWSDVRSIYIGMVSSSTKSILQAEEDVDWYQHFINTTMIYRAEKWK